MQARKDEASGRQFYIDHNSRKTTWVRPKPPHPAPPTTSTNAPAAGSAFGYQEPSEGVGAEPLVAAEGADISPASSSPHGEFGLFGLGLDEVMHMLNPGIQGSSHQISQSMPCGRDHLPSWQCCCI